MIYDLQGNGRISPPLDGATPIFEMSGAAPDSTYLRPPGSIVRFGTSYYWQVGTLSAPVWVALSSTESAAGAPTGGLALAATALDVVSRWRGDAQRALSLTPATLQFQDYQHARGTTGTGASVFLVGSGARTGTTKGVRLTNGAAAAANNGVNLGYGFVVTASSVLSVLAGAAKWWLRTSMSVVGGAAAIGAASRIGIGGTTDMVNPLPANRSLMAGVVGNVSVANFAAAGTAGVAMDSGVAITADIREVTIWNDGASTFLSVADRTGVLLASPVTGNVRPAADSQAMFQCFDDSGNQRNVDLYLSAIAFEAA